MADILFRLLEDEDIEKVNVFYNNYHEAGRTYEKFQWEFRQSPHGKGIYVLALDSGTGKILGIQAGILVVMIDSQGRETLTVKSEDTLLDVDACSEFRGRDVFRELYAFFREECQRQSVSFIWGFTWVIRSLKRIGCEFPFIARQKIMVLKPFSSYKYLSALNPANTFPDRFRIFGMAVVSWVLGMLRGMLFLKRTGFTITDEPASNTELFQNLSGNENLLFIKQDEPYLRWRLIDNPYFLDYKITNMFENGVLKAQVISSLNPDGQAYIEQMLFDPGVSSRNRKRIIRSVIADLKSRGACHIRVMVFEKNKINQAESQLFCNAGFLEVKPGMGFFFINLRPGEPVDAGSLLISRLYTQGHS